jgi:hypothetical protein
MVSTGYPALFSSSFLIPSASYRRSVQQSQRNLNGHQKLDLCGGFQLKHTLNITKKKVRWEFDILNISGILLSMFFSVQGTLLPC